MRRNPQHGIIDRERLAVFRDAARKCDDNEQPLEEQVAELRAIVQALCAEFVHQDARRW